VLQAGLLIGTLALGQRAALGQSGGAHAHMPELGVAKLPVVPAMDQPLVEPEIRRSPRLTCEGRHHRGVLEHLLQVTSSRPPGRNVAGSTTRNGNP
jgi:hypothetical protein